MSRQTVDTSADAVPDDVGAPPTAHDHGRTRVTVDLDGHVEDFELRAVRVWHELRRVADETAVRVSSGGKGLHFVGWLTTALTDAQKNRLRRHLGDDPNRVLLDEMRGRIGHTTNVLWTKKGNGEPDADFENVYDALDYIRETTTTPGDRLRRDVQYGLVV